MADIARRGVSLVATAHGTSLQSLLDNPILNALVGGKHEVIVGDMQAGCVIAVFASMQLCHGRQQVQSCEEEDV